MSRISRVFDNDLKKQVFMIRGDENYVRSTSIVIGLDNFEMGDDTYAQKFKVSVFRDIGDSAVQFYANDELVKTIEWSDTCPNDSVVTLGGLYYNTDYVFKAVYIGNDECLKSSSKNIPLNRIPGEYDTAITTDLRTVYTDDIVYTITLECEQQGLVSGKPITIDITTPGGAHWIKTVTLNEDGKFTDNLGSLNDGLYEIDVKFNGTTVLQPSRLIQKVSRGYKLEPFESEKIVTPLDRDVNFKVILQDYIGNTYSDKEVILELQNGPISNMYRRITDDFGITEYNISYYIDGEKSWQDFTTAKYIFNTTNDAQEPIQYITTVPITNITPATPVITKTPEIVSKNSPVTITVQTTPMAGIPIRLEISRQDNKILFTNETGKITYTYNGDGKGPTTVKAVCGDYGNDIHSEITYTDYLQYWEPGKIFNQDYRPLNNIATLQNVFRLVFGWFKIYVEPDKPFILKITGVTTTGTGTYFYGESSDYTDNANITIPAEYSVEKPALTNSAIILTRDSNHIRTITVGDTTKTIEGINSVYPALMVYTDGTNINPTFTKLELWEGE